MVITSTHFRRPFYSERSIAALAAQPESFLCHYHANIDHGQNAEKIRGIVMEYADSFADTSIIVRRDNPSCNGNTRSALENAMKFAPDFVVLVEDDVVLGRDALAWFAEMAAAHADDKNILTVSAWRHPEGWMPDCGREKRENENHETGTTRWFTPWGWGTWPDRLREILVSWTTGTDLGPIEKGRVVGSWDEHLNHRVVGDRLEIHPMISRAQNIGHKLGTHRGALELSHWINSDG